MINNLDPIQGLRLNPDAEASRLSSSLLLVQSSKGETDIFDFDLNNVQLGSGQPREVISKKCTICPKPRTRNSICNQCRK